MKRNLLCLLAFFGAALAAHAQISYSGPYIYAAGQFPGSTPQFWEVRAVALPTALTTITGTTPSGTTKAIVETLSCTTKGTAATLTLQDAASGVPLLYAVPIAANTLYTINWTPTPGTAGVTLPGGVAWMSTGGPVYCSATGRF